MFFGTMFSGVTISIHDCLNAFCCQDVEDEYEVL